MSNTRLGGRIFERSIPFQKENLGLFQKFRLAILNEVKNQLVSVRNLIQSPMICKASGANVSSIFEYSVKDHCYLIYGYCYTNLLNLFI